LSPLELVARIYTGEITSAPIETELRRIGYRGGHMSIDQVTLPLAFAAGFASFLSPCVLPLVPAYLAYLGRQAGRQPAVGSAGPGAVAVMTALDQRPPPPLALFSSGLTFVAGLSLVFIAFFYALSSLLVPFRTIVTPIAGAFVVILGLSTAGLFRLRFMNYEFKLFAKAPERQGPLGGFLLGIGFAAGWTPCVGVTLGAVISSGIARGTTAQGLVLMAGYCLGLCLPFLLLGLAADRSAGLVRVLGSRRRLIDLASGGILVAMGALLMTNNLLMLTNLLSRVLPSQLLNPFRL
jgi:cytochrome c-type biogenesis protein